MNKLLIVLIFICSQFTNAQSFSVMKNSNDCTLKLKKKADATKTIGASFKETVVSSMFNTPKSGNGILRYKKESKIRWEKETPHSEIVLINGSSIKMIQKGKVVDSPGSNKIAKKMQSLMLGLLRHEFLNQKDFSIVYYESKTQYKLVLKPKKSIVRKYITAIELVFNKSNLALDNIKILESEQDYVTYNFTSVVFNQSIPESKFTQF